MNRVLASILFFGLLTLASTTCYSQTSSIIRVPTHVWSELAQDEKDQATARYVIDLVPSDSIGVIIDAQGVDRSDPGTTAGQQLGAALGSAAYVDNAFRGRPDYSAKSHLGASLLGAVLGSALDRPASAKYQFRYSVKTLINKIEYLDDHTTEPFRKSLGACVLIPSLAAVSQDICSENADSFRRKYLLSRGNLPSPKIPTAGHADPAATVPVTPATTPPSAIESRAEIVKCKFGNNPPVAIDRGVCQSAKGELLP